MFFLVFQLLAGKRFDGVGGRYLEPMTECAVVRKEVVSLRIARFARRTTQNPPIFGSTDKLESNFQHVPLKRLGRCGMRSFLFTIILRVGRLLPTFVWGGTISRLSSG